MKIQRYHFETIGSTNTWAKENAHAFFLDSMTLVTAKTQTAGRGRFNRQWLSPATDNIYATFCFFVEKERKDIGNIPQVLAIVTAQTLQGLGFESALKWPNDILLSDKKVAGILCETTPLEKLCVVLGIGVNVNMSQDELAQIDRPATSLAIEGKTSLVSEELLNLLQINFLQALQEFLEKGFLPFLPDYKKLLWVPSNLRLCFHDNQRIWSGKFHAINDDGSLSLQLDDGEIKVFVAGEILP